MKCPKCQECDSKVVESRDVSEGGAIRRRRECLKCSHRFTTYERLETPYLAIRKKNGDIESFDRTKILGGLTKACEKRPVTMVQLEQVVDNIERMAYERGENEISSHDIGEMVMDQLMTLDDVAYVRFASVYRSFADLGSFEKELAKLKRRHVKSTGTKLLDKTRRERVSSKTADGKQVEVSRHG